MNFWQFARWSGVLALAFTAGPAASGDADLAALFAERLRPIMPDVQIRSIKPSPIAGLYEIMVGSSVLYISEDGAHVISGDVFDLNTRRNLTDIARRTSRAAQLAALDPAEFIEFPARGETIHTLFVFTDVDCTYCRAMHKEVKTLTDAGFAVRYLAFPRTGIDSESYDKAVAVWCSADRQSAITRAKAGEKVLSAACENPVAAQFHMGELMSVTGTPAVFMEDGRQIGGYVPAKDLIEKYGKQSG